MSDTEVLALVLKRSAKFQRTIRWRDARELVAAGLVVLVLAPTLSKGSWLARAGAGLIVAGCGLIFVMLMSARRLAAPRPDWPLAQVVRTEEARVGAQVRLLETLLWWYIAPLSAGAVLIVAGDAGVSWFTAGYVLFVVAVAAGIYWFNRIALRRDLWPRRAELRRLLDQLER
jgi:hypothetical protein